MRHTRRLATLFTALAAAIAVLFLSTTGTANAARPTATAATAPITGTFTDASGGAGTFVGTLSINKVQQQAGSLVATGTLTGTLTDSSGATQTISPTAVTLPLQVTGTCQILHLTLGPLDLNLLGLMVHLDRVVLDITAQQGPGNLLGNLLCAVANLLNTGGSQNALVNLLNQILALLG